MSFWLILAAWVTATCLVVAFWPPAGGMADRFARYAEVETPDERPPGWADDWRGRTIGQLAPHVAKALPANYLEATRGRLRQAGLYLPLHLQAYLVIQAGCAVAGAFLGLAFGGHAGASWGAAAFAAGALLPHAGLTARIRARQQQIDGSLPDSIDLLTACVEAGLGLDAAIAQLTRRRTAQSQALNQELTRYLQELQVGVSRSDALRGLGGRSGVEDLRHVVTALVHGDALGVGVAQILRAQAKHLRLRRKQRAEERAMKAPIKILFPLLFGIFPSIFVIVLGPAALRISDNFIGKF